MMSSISHRSSSQSAASEAIFSKTGQIQKRIKNFETTVVDTSNSILVFPPLACNNEIDLPDVLDTVSDISANTSDTTKRPARFSATLVGIIIIMTFSWSIYSLFFTTKIDFLAFESVTSNQNQTTATSSNVFELKKAADQLLASQTWKSFDVTLFLNHWNKLSEQEVSQATTTTWYQLLESHVKKQIDRHHNGSLDPQVSGVVDQSLMTLGLVMGVNDNSGNTLTNKIEYSKYDKLLVDLANDLKQADEKSNTSTKTQESESHLNEKLREKYASVNQIPHKSNSTVTTIPTRKANIQSAVNSRVTKLNIDSIITDYKRAYEKGDIILMAKLFGASDIGTSSYENVKSSFKTTFDNTINRTMNIYDVDTVFSGNSAVVNGNFNTAVEFKNGKGTQYTVAKIKLNISKSADQITINRVDILDRKVNVVENNSKPLNKNNEMLTTIDTNAVIPTAAELQDITTQLVTSYETGDLDQFISLLSPEIKTNDRIDLAGVKNDYAKLFSSTADRQMFIQNLKWTKDTIGAKGTGNLEVTILSNEGNTVYTMEGKIQIVAQKFDRKVKITHMYHIERAK